MRDDDRKNIDVPSKVRAFRKEFAADQAAIYTSYEVTDIAGVPAVVGHAKVVSLGEPAQLLSEAFATRGLRPPIPGAQGMKDTRDAERAMTGAVGRALFLMGFGDRPDDSADYEEPDPDQWFRENGWNKQVYHDTFKEDAKQAVRELPEKYQTQVKAAWEQRGLHWPMSKQVFDVWSDYLAGLRRLAEEEAGREAGDVAGGEPASQPSLENAVGPDAPLMVKRA